MPGGIGNGGLVVRAGDTVRRPVGPQTKTVEALLRHLERKGFDGAPRHLGYDERGREVLTYVPGDVPHHEDVPEWVTTDEALVSVLTLMRRLHDATLDFVPPADAEWAWPPPPHRRGDVIGHNDACRENVVFEGGRAKAFVDFDFAGPATRAWDVAGVVRHFVLGLPGDVQRRYDLVLATYPVDDLKQAVLDRLEWGLAMVTERAARGEAGFVAQVERGIAERNAERRAVVRSLASPSS
ncbi:MAG TPA: phosphotransferase [Frankiaceae bacterium]|nr:phosphotransferase [Frankiaceae bacterium]